MIVQVPDEQQNAATAGMAPAVAVCGDAQGRAIQKMKRTAPQTGPHRHRCPTG